MSEHIDHLDGQHVTVHGLDRHGIPATFTAPLSLTSAMRPARCPECGGLHRASDLDPLAFAHVPGCELCEEDEDQGSWDLARLQNLEYATHVPQESRPMEVHEVALVEEGLGVDLPLDPGHVGVLLVGKRVARVVPGT